MPQVPKFTPQGRDFGALINADVNPRSFGSEGRAIAGVGQAVSNISSKILEVRTKAEENDAINTAITDYATSYNEKIREKRQNLGDQKIEDGAFSREMAKFSQAKIKELEAKMPSNRAKNAWSSSIAGQHRRNLLLAQSEELKHNANVYKQNLDRGVDNLASVVSTDFSDETFGLALSHIENQSQEGIGTMFNTKLEANEWAEKKKQQIADSQLKGLIRSNPGEALRRLSGSSFKVKYNEDGSLDMEKLEGDIQKNIYDDVLGAKKQAYVIQAENALKQNLRSNATETRAQIQESIFASQKNGTVDPSLVNKINELKFSESISPQQGDRILIEAAGAAASGIYSQSIASADPQTRANAKEQAISYKKNLEKQFGIKRQKNVGIREDAQFVKRLEAIDNQAQKELEQDPFSFVMRGNEKLKMELITNQDDPEAFKKTIEKVIIAQRDLGVAEDNIQLMSDEQADQFASIFKAGNADQIANKIDLLDRQYGEHFPKAMAQLANENKIPAAYTHVAFAAPGARVNLIGAIQNHKNVVDEIGKSEFNDIKKRIEKNSKLRNMSQIFSKGDPTHANSAISAGFKEMVAIEAAGLARTENTNAAVEKAVQNITGRYEIVSDTVIPKRVPIGDGRYEATNMDYVRSSMGRVRSSIKGAEKFLDKKLRIPINKAKGAKASKESYEEQLRLNGFFRTNTKDPRKLDYFVEINGLVAPVLYEDNTQVQIDLKFDDNKASRLVKQRKEEQVAKALTRRN